MTILIVTCILLHLLIFPKQTALYTAQGLTLWYRQVVPTLLPFCILSYIIIQTDLYHSLFQKLERILPERFCQSTESLYPICMGRVCGFPIGSKLTDDLYRLGHLHDDQVTRLCAISNQFGPAFLVNYALISQLHLEQGWKLLLPAVYLPPLVSGFLWYLFSSRDKTDSIHKKPVSQSQLNVKIIDTGIINGFETMLRIAGYIIIFSIISGMIQQLSMVSETGKALMAGLCEITTGIQKLSAVSLPVRLKLTLISGIVPFGGFCGLFQTKAMMRHTPFSTAAYVRFKLCCSLMGMCISYALFPFL